MFRFFDKKAKTIEQERKEKEEKQRKENFGEMAILDPTFYTTMAKEVFCCIL